MIKIIYQVLMISYKNWHNSVKMSFAILLSIALDETEDQEKGNKKSRMMG
jgi:hypothetical protein